MNSKLFFAISFLLSLTTIRAQQAKPDNPFFKGHNSQSRSSLFTYTLTTSYGTYTDLTGAVSLNNGELWDEPEYTMPIAFPFELNGNPISSLTFFSGGAAMLEYTSNPDVFTAIFAFETDLVDRGSFGSTSLSPISYKVEGTAPDRIQKMEFKNAGSYIEMDNSGTLDMFVNFQMWLFESGDKIEFHYGPGMVNDPATFYDGESGPAVGLLDYDEENEEYINLHIVAGPVNNPFLTEAEQFLSGTPENGTIYILSLGEPLALTVHGENSTSFCDHNGSAEAIVTGGSTPYSYIWNTGATTSVLSNLGAGTYFVTVTDASGYTATGFSGVSEVPVLDLNEWSTDETQVDANDGTATISPVGGTNPLDIEWSTGATSLTISNLAPGSYSVTVTDGEGCSASANVIVNEFGCPAIEVEVGITPNSCFGSCDGELEILSVTNGQQPYSFEWSNGGDDVEIGFLCFGVYGLTVTDANGCAVIEFYDITQPDSISVNATSSNESIIGHHDGAASANPIGGTPPYSYLWSNGSTTQTIINLEPGTYTVTVIDANGCSASQTVTVEEGGCGYGQAESNNISCFDECDGSITAVYTSGVAPFNYVWNTGDTVATLLDLCEGLYMATITDATGCSINFQVLLTQPNELLANAGHTNETIATADGSVWAAPFGGTPPYSYVWNNGSTDSLLINLIPGDYTVTVTDFNGCEDIQTVTVEPHTCLDINLTDQIDVSCFGVCDGLIAIEVTGGIGPYALLWNTGDTSSTLQDLCAGFYKVIVADLNQLCVDSASFSITQPDSVYAVVDTVLHLTDSSTTSIQVTGYGGSGSLSFLWTNPDGFFVVQEDLFDILPGVYSLIVLDLNGCSFTIDSIEVLDLTVGLIPLDPISVSLYPNPAKDHVVVDVPELNRFRIEMYTADGRKMREWKNVRNLDVGGFSEGLYFVRLVSENSYALKTLIINR